MNKVDWSAEYIIQVLILAIIANALYEWLKHNAKKLSDINVPNIRSQNLIGSILGYIMPLGVIGYMMIDNTMPATFRSLGYFIISIGSIVFNLLMERVIGIYKMLGELTGKAQGNDEVQKEAINKLCEILNIPKAFK